MDEENGILQEQGEEQRNDRQKDPKLGILYAQVFCIALLLTGLMALKMFFPSYFSEIKKWYENNFLTETSVSDVLDNSSVQSVPDNSTVSGGSSVSDNGSSVENSSQSSGNGENSSGSTTTESTNQGTTEATSSVKDGESNAF